MSLIVRIPDELASQIVAAGGDPEQVALAALRQAAERLEHASQPAVRVDDEAAQGAGARAAAASMRRNRVGNTLPPGVTIRELLTDGRD